jgi:phenylacetate-CoA ligase
VTISPERIPHTNALEDDYPERRFLEPEIETATRREIEKIQEQRILELVPYVWERSSFYRALWSAAEVEPEDIRSLHDFTTKIPTFGKKDLRAYRERTGDPFSGLLCVDPQELTSITSTSGTTGTPELIPEIWDVAPPLAAIWARDMWELGLRPGDRALIPGLTFRNYFDDLFRALGLIPVFIDSWVGHGEEVLQAIKRHNVSYVKMILPMVLEFEALEKKYDMRDMLSSLKGATFAGQPLGEVLTRKIREEWGVNLFNFTSAGDTGTAWESGEHDGFQLWEDTIFPEVLDPLTGAAVGDRQVGELVATDLDNRAAPYIRFWSEDLVRLTREPSSSGRTHARMWLVGRAGDEVKVAAKNLVVADVWEHVESIHECSDAVFQIVKYAEEMVVLRIRLGYTPDRTSDVNELRERSARLLEQNLGVPVHVELLPSDQILERASSAVKIQRVVKS